jgi:WD40 repeat protein
MKVDADENLEAEYPSLLAACEAALDSPAPPSSFQAQNVPPDVQLDLERDMACVKLLRQVLPLLDCSAAPTAADRTDGQSVLPWTHLGRFEIRRELGRGSHGIVYLAYDPGLGREVALKIPRADVLADPDLRHRFQREARAAAGLDHPNLVPVYEAGEVGPVCYIAAAYCPGITLAHWLKQHEAPVPYRTAAELVAVLAEAVEYAHRHGVVHRDLKPGNILLVSGGMVSGESAEPPPTTPKITDFGLAKLLPSQAVLSAQTQTGAIVGTANYMAPEQAGSRAGQVGPAADHYALGVILYELLTGRTPFQGDSALEVLLRVRTEEPLSPARLRRKVPRDLETICLRCLQKEPHKRYASAGALAEDLRHFLAGEPIQARPIRPWERTVKWARRRPAIAALTAAVFVITVLGFGLVGWQWLRAEAALGQVADKAKAEAEANRQLAQTLYFSLIALAYRELSSENWGRAEEVLQQCQDHLRGWEYHYLRRLRHAPPFVIRLGERRIMGDGFDMAFSPDSRLLALPSGDNTIKIWDVAGSQRAVSTPRFILCGHTDCVVSVAFSPDGQRLASSSADNTVRIWDLTATDEPEALATGGSVLTALRTLEGHTDRVLSVAFSPDHGRLLATASNDRTVKLWNTCTGQLLFDLPGQSVPNDHVHLAFSPDGRYLASGSESNTVRVWNVVTGQELFRLVGHTQPVFNVTFSPDGRRLVSAGHDGLVKVWDLPRAEPGASAPGGRVLAPQYTFTERSYSVWCVAFSPDGQRLAVGSELSDGAVRVYDAATGGLLLPPLRGHRRVASVAFNADGRRLASAGLDKTVRLWDTETGREILTLTDHTDLVGRVLFSPDGQRLASASADGTVRLWDASPYDEAADRSTATLRGHSGEVYDLAFSEDGRLASASADKSIKIWNTKTAQEEFTLRGHTDTVFSVAYSPDGRHLISGSHDKTAKLWDTESRKVLYTLDDFKGMVRSVAFSPDGRTIATGSVQLVQLWDAKNGQELNRRLYADPEHVRCVTFSRNGKHLAAVGAHMTAIVWNPDSGEQVSFRGHLTRVISVAFHPTGEFLASGDGDYKVKLWNAATGKGIDTLSGHTDFVVGIAFSPNGQYLATASWREVIVWIWDGKSFAQVQKLGRFAGPIWCLAFSPDGKRLAAGGGYKGKGEIKIWDASLWE